MPDELLKRDGVTWVVLAHAARISKIKVVEIQAMIAREEVIALDHAGHSWITLGTANRLKRETAAIRSIQRNTKLGDAIPEARRYSILEPTWDPSTGPRLPLPPVRRKPDGQSRS